MKNKIISLKKNNTHNTKDDSLLNKSLRNKEKNYFNNKMGDIIQKIDI